ncbi:MAG: response regulator [Clostridia bacterium]|nr:response regulator [Clostridia bacterium]
MHNERKTILVVDDDNIILMLVHGLLKAQYRCVPVRSGADALDFLQQDSADLVLLDMEMPDMGGMEVAEAIHAQPNYNKLPILLLTGVAENHQQLSLLQNANVVDVIRKPFLPSALLRQVEIYLELFDLREQLDQMVRERTAGLAAQRGLLVSMFSNLIEYRDQAQGEHIQRLQAVVRKVIVGYNKLFPERAIKDAEAERIVLGSQMHDIGKVSIADAILLKPGRLTPEEYDIMKKHTVYGAQTLQSVEDEDPDGLLQIARQIAASHHEKWDGSGYPDGQRGEQIPLPARIVAVADVLDALMSLRPYRRALHYDQAVQSMVEARGKHFDPDLVDAFLDQSADIEDIYVSYGDS